MGMFLNSIEPYDKYKTITKGLYFVDKTELLEELIPALEQEQRFFCITRPRRFGKTLNMSMLRTFFEIGMDKSPFEGLYISKNKELCDEYMGKYPVIFLSLKGIDGLTFEEAIIRITTIIKNEARRHHYLKNSDKLIEEEIKQFQSLLDGKADDITDSIRLLSELLCKHYGKKTIILIDEYDVPLQSAYQNNYYDEMVDFLRSVFSSALKTNDALEKGIMTGCLRISKESIFTGLNNFNVLSVMSPQFDECFGFTDEEVKEMLAYYGLSEHYEQKELLNILHDKLGMTDSEIDFFGFDFDTNIEDEKDLSIVHFHNDDEDYCLTTDAPFYLWETANAYVNTIKDVKDRWSLDSIAENIAR